MDLVRTRIHMISRKICTRHCPHVIDCLDAIHMLTHKICTRHYPHVIDSLDAIHMITHEICTRFCCALFWLGRAEFRW